MHFGAASEPVSAGESDVRAYRGVARAMQLRSRQPARSTCFSGVLVVPLRTQVPAAIHTSDTHEAARTLLDAVGDRRCYSPPERPPGGASTSDGEAMAKPYA